MRAFKYIKEPKAFEIIADETRRRIIYLLRAREYTVSQLAEALEKTPQAIYHHIRKLLEAGMVEVGREERVDHFIETYYRATAEVFEFGYGESGGQEYAEQHTRETLEALTRLGLNVNIIEDTVSKLVDLERRVKALGANPELEERIAQLEGVHFLSKQEIAHFMRTLAMSDQQFEDYIKHQREFRQILKSTLVEPLAVPTKMRRPKPK